MAALLALLLLAPPSAPADKGPSLSETARLYFLAGDVRKALEWCTRGMKTEPRRCKPMIKALAEYGYLAERRDAFTPADAKAFLEWDRAISPTTPSKLTEPTIARFVTEPLARARALAAAGGAAPAQELVAQVLLVDPRNPAALALRDELRAGPDAGRPAADGGGADEPVGQAQGRPRQAGSGR